MNIKQRMRISIFARKYFTGENAGTSTGPYLHRGTSLIRGEQVAEYLGGKYNPQSGFEDDICIYLKPKTLDHIKDGSYVDFSDGESYLLKLLQNRPNIKVIASSQTSFEFLKESLKNEIFLIPEHHCNFEKLTRTRKEVTTGGIITNPSPISYKAYDEVARKLKELGFDFITCFNWKTRQDVVDFYQKIDFQVISMFGVHSDYDPFRHPTKIINAASYGIPTVANWKAGYKEFEENYIPVHNISDLVKGVEKLKNQDYYEGWSGKIIKAAEPYHIENIAKLYKQLA